MHLARAEAALLDDAGLSVDLHHAGLGADDQQPVVGDGVAHRPQAVAVHAGDHPAAVGSAQIAAGPSHGSITAVAVGMNRSR